MAFSEANLDFEPERQVSKITECIRRKLASPLRRRGLVVGLSGGIDSSVTTALAVRAVGPGRVLALLMPERHSARETLDLGRQVADCFGVRSICEDITGTLTAVGFYRRYARAIQTIIPEYGAGWTSKIVISNLFESKGYNHFSVVVQRPDQHRIKKRLPLNAYLEIVAATNFKQRIRKMMEYYHADRLNYAVAGTPNRLEYDQGFFVKLGDGAADIKPIAHLYKTQVYRIAEYLGIPDAVRDRPPTTDTYSMVQGQDEFYFSLPYEKMDLCLYGKNNKIPAEKVAPAVGLTQNQVERVYDDIDAKRSSTRYLHLSPMMIEPVAQIDGSA